MMAFSSIRTRLTRTSSDLRKLSAVLLPPSPVLKADESLISSTSGEIPILLEVATQNCDFLPPFREALGLCDYSEKPKMIGSTGNMRNLTCGDVAIPKTWMGVEPGRRCTNGQLPSDRVHAAEPPSGSVHAGAASDSLEGVPHPDYCDFLAGDSVHLSTGTGDNSLLPTSEKGGDTGELRDSQTCHPDTKALTSSPTSSKGNLDGDQSPMFAASHTYSTLPTPIFESPSASPSEDVMSLSSSPTWRQRHHRPLERARAVRFPGRPRSPRIQVDETEARFVRTSPPFMKHAYPRWQPTDSPMTATYSCPTDTVYPFVKHVVLPEELWWLKRTIIELWIDQEGFRAVRPRMQLIGYSPRTRSLHPYEPAEDAGSNATAGVAEFMPTKRETFAFHYATLDSPPILRTVSVAGDESRDYISRHASLSIKVNGVYTVLGTETFITSMQNCDAHGPRFQNMRLRWKFDYLVSDRKVDGTGRTLPGEKTLTPLTFSCSPYLFHPLQGKKAGLMHVVKKNLVPKLGSQKLEPPACSPGRGTLPHAPRVGNGRDVVTHARSHSDAFTKGGHYSHAQSVLDAGVKEVTTQRVRRRRASSAGEDSLNQCAGNASLKEGMSMTSSALVR